MVWQSPDGIALTSHQILTWRIETEDCFWENESVRFRSMLILWLWHWQKQWVWHIMAEINGAYNHARYTRILFQSLQGMFTVKVFATQRWTYWQTTSLHCLYTSNIQTFRRREYLHSILKKRSWRQCTLLRCTCVCINMLHQICPWFVTHLALILTALYIPGILLCMWSTLAQISAQNKWVWLKPFSQVIKLNAKMWHTAKRKNVSSKTVVKSYHYTLHIYFSHNKDRKKKKKI